jgi:hypothetical protein
LTDRRIEMMMETLRKKKKGIRILLWGMRHAFHPLKREGQHREGTLEKVGAVLSNKQILTFVRGRRENTRRNLIGRMWSLTK